ncbi:MAG: flavodoxin [Gammaproteobacteria bacterium]|nr:flavodoxin [Gammaproteobacteria bacterium]
MKHLLIVYHSQTGNTKALADAVMRGACLPDIEGVYSQALLARDAGVEDVLRCDGLILGTPENFGYMSGGMKDFLDRIFYPLQGRVDGLPYALFVCAGNDGSGAKRAVKRIASGLALKEVQTPLIFRGQPDDPALHVCTELGSAMAAGLELGVF